MKELMAAHWEEIASHQDIRTLKPNVDVFTKMEEQGRLFTLFVMDGEEIAGYSVNILAEHLHSDTLYAQNDAVYVSPAYRRSGAGIRLMKATERAAKEHGAQLLFWHAKQGSRLESVLGRMGYGVLDVIFSKEL